MELGAARLRQRLVGGVADQQVPEPERVVIGKERRARPDELLANEAEQTRGHVGVVGREGRDRAAVEDLSLDRAPLERGPLGGRELVEPRREERLDRPRHRHRIRRLLDHREHLLDEERVAFRGRPDPLAQLRSSAGRRGARRSARRSPGPKAARAAPSSRSASRRPSPAAARAARAAPGRGAGSGRPATVGDVLDQVEERRLAPVDVVEDDHERPVRSNGLQELAHSARDLLGGRLPRRGAARRLPGRRAAIAEKLLQHPTTGQYVIPSPYDRHLPPATVASSPSRNSAVRRDLPTPAVPRMVKSEQARSERVRSQASSSSRRSRVRPTSGASWRRATATSPVTARSR